MALPLLLLWKGGTDPRATWILGIFIGLAALYQWKRGPVHKIEGALVMVLTAFAAWTAVSFFASTTQTWGFNEVIRDAALMLLVWLSMQTEVHDRRRILQSLLAVTIVAACVGLVVYVLQPGDRLVGTFFDSALQEEWPNTFASLLLLAWPLAFVALPKKWNIACAAFFFGCIALTASRGALLALGAQLLVASTLWLKDNRGSLRTQKAHLLAIIFGAACVLATVFAANTVRHVTFPVVSLSERVSFTGNDKSRSMQERWNYWKQALAMVSERPLLGWGPDSFGSVQQRFQTVAAETTAHPHSVYLKYMAERGVTGFLLFLLLISCVIFSALARLRARTVHAEERSIMRMMLLSLLGVLLHNLLDTTVTVPGMAIPFWILAGLVLVQEPMVHRVHRAHSLLFVSAAGALLVMSAMEYARPRMLRGLTELQDAAELLQQNDVQGAGRLIQDFRRLSPEEPQGAFLLAQFFVLSNRQEEANILYKEAFEKGGWNSPAMVADYLQTLAAEEPDALAQHHEQIHAMTVSFAEAITQNRHGVARGDIPEQFSELVDVLIFVYPASRTEWEALRERANNETTNWRRYFAERPQGKLWN